MSARETEQPPELLTLDPLYTDGPDALDTHDTPGIANARLSEIEIHWHTPKYGVTIRRAKDLFALQQPGESLTPPAGQITKATFELLFDDAPRPHKVTIQLPGRLTLEFPSDAPRVNPWLDKRRFRIPTNILNALAAILLALASALAPVLDDDDGDDDDISSDRHSFSA